MGSLKSMNLYPYQAVDGNQGDILPLEKFNPIFKLPSAHEKFLNGNFVWLPFSSLCCWLGVVRFKGEYCADRPVLTGILCSTL